MFYFEVFVGDSFPQVVQHQFLERFHVQFFGADHFGFIGRFFRFEDDANGRVGVGPVVDDEVVSAFGVDEMVWVVVRFF